MSALTKIYCPKCREGMELEEAMLSETILCQHCGHDFTARDGFDFEPPQPLRANPNHPALSAGGSEKSNSPVFAALLIIVGVAGTVFFSFFFDVSVQTGDGVAVVNLGLSNDRLVGVIASAGVALAGIILLGVSQITHRK